MRALFALLAWLCVAGAAVAQMPPGAYGPGPCPFGASSCKVTATGGTTARTLAQHFAECDAGGANCATFNAKDWGITPAASGASNQTNIAAMVAAACGAGSNQYKTLYFPAGFYPWDTTAGAISLACQNISIKGDGEGTVFNMAGSNDAWSVPVTTGGFVAFRNFRMYRTDNVASGRAILIGQGPAWLNDMHLDGQFGALEIASAGGIFVSDISVGGANTAAGAFGLKVHRSGNAATNPAEIFFTNFNIRPTTTNAVVLKDFDGIWLTNGHIGFSTSESLLIQPEFTSDQLTGLKVSNVDFDGGTYGVRFAALGGYAGVMGFDSFSGSSAEGATADGFSMEDPGMIGLSLTGWKSLSAAHNGVNIQAGTGISWSGGGGVGNNTAASTFADLVVGGTSANVTVGDLHLISKGAAAPADHIQIANSANHVTIGANTYKGATSLDVNSTTSGTDVVILPGTTDKTAIAALTSGTQAIGNAPAAGGDAIPAFRLEVNSQTSDPNTLLITNSGAFSRTAGVAFKTPTTADGHAFTSGHLVVGNTGANNSGTYLTLGSASGANAYRDEMTVSNNLVLLGAVTHAAVHLATGQTTAPALTSCGTSPAIVGTDTAGLVTMGTTATGCVITFNTAYTATPFCVVSWIATPLASQSYVTSNAAITTTQTSTSNNKLQYVCMAQAGG